MTESHWAQPFFTGKTVVVTGGTSGIGLGLASAFRDAGATVHATGATAAEVEVAGATPGIGFAVLDVRNDAAVNAYAARFERADVLVNCAGVNLRAAEFTPEGFSTVLDINLTGSMRAATAFRAKLGGGAILNIASMFAFFGAPHAPAYAASKGGVASMTLPMARDLAQHGIRVVTIAPGLFMTPMMKGLPEAAQASLAASVPFPRRLGQPAEYAHLVASIVENGMLNGEVIRLDGALRMAPR